MPGLRERKKQQTRQAISDAAIALFLDAGYEQTSVAAIAEAAAVSRRTLFSYFPAKDDLVLHRIADHAGEAARVVRNRPARWSPLAALRAHHLAGLNRRDPATGLCDDSEVLALYGLINEHPVLANGLLAFRRRDAAQLADALLDTGNTNAFRARMAAAQFTTTQHLLAEDNVKHLVEGQSAAERHPGAVADAETAFALLSDGLRKL
ncbi:TetR/AcrR family transcriptional regulator [Nocardia blacklockiae]|uniref:TetR/AcrR family transcriptional regulator n=1 Tax=Nocardia blacklockiae TaxID=480036 RepID=UPI00189582CF|nr:TetR/AcrR family transcriptional regulator [Nocardia blacklockiae]MBF6176815.1 TetR family transcriptional regulator [Nocardia blacklockiae]